MNIFKKLIKRRPKNKQTSQKSAECWYNNVHENAESKLGEPLEGAALSGSNQYEYSVTKSNSMN